MKLDLTSPEHHPTSKFPNAMRHLLYYNNNLLSLIKFTGCPNSGGEHHLIIDGTRQDILSWLDLFVDSYPATRTEVRGIKKSIYQKFLKDPDCNFCVKLKEINHGIWVDGKLVNRPWYWYPALEFNNV